MGQRWAQLSAEQKAAWSAKAAAMRRSERGGGGVALSGADDGAAPAMLSFLQLVRRGSFQHHHSVSRSRLPEVQRTARVAAGNCRLAFHVLQLQASLTHTMWQLSRRGAIGECLLWFMIPSPGPCHDNGRLIMHWAAECFHLAHAQSSLRAAPSATTATTGSRSSASTHSAWQSGGSSSTTGTRSTAQHLRTSRRLSNRP